MRRALARQRVVNRLAEQGRLRVVALYSSPEEDEAAWRASLGEYPDGWIAAYDAGAQVHYRGLYDLRRVPCLYLLDARKRVLVQRGRDGGTDRRGIGKSHFPLTATQAANPGSRLFRAGRQGLCRAPEGRLVVQMKKKCYICPNF